MMADLSVDDAHFSEEQREWLAKLAKSKPGPSSGAVADPPPPPKSPRGGEYSNLLSLRRAHMHETE